MGYVKGFFSFSKLGQSAIEFMIIVGFMLFVLVAFLTAINYNISDKRFDEKNRIAKEIALSVQNEISLASNSLDGYSREFEVPLRIAELDYTIAINSGLLYLETEDSRHAVAYPIAEVTGDIQIGANVIQKEGGVVLLNQ
tara:strand:- start:554 stop:973 length:420 start_codon:yes stop_codon:yes gene_type:complete